MRRSHSKFRPAPYDHGARIARIDLTPLAAVGCILSALLMLALPNPTHALLFDLPSVGPPSEEFNVPEHQLRQHRDGTLYLNGEPVLLGDLQPLLTALGQTPYEPTLWVEMSGDTPYGAALPVMAAISTSGIQQVWLCFPTDVRPDRYARRWPYRDAGEVEAGCIPLSAT
ncbi:biopolymer transporter ExbD [Altererythrobacter sp. KTW20L]|uniref:ExbD/TolR family protein n=1 Tax=Altererythrobacter sp. KTW20L TaxID=2942210 RepID=UPI0020C05983|nr:biopolymer transporter ExbD [Altererythrobacter sp. KTW20L]MCL6249848.1 biopolymer transporter ExbD [Altererythrobacter sp. KTW20L]